MIYYKDADFSKYKKISGRGKCLNNVVGAFDIETTACLEISFMYIWQFAVNDTVVYGRTWDEFVDCLTKIKDDLALAVDRRLIVYVHSLSYEFTYMQYIKGLFFSNAEYDFLAREQHDVIKCVINDVFEFRDSYAYTEISLADMGEIVGLKKLELDYSKTRHSSTPLTEAELEYCSRDVEILVRYFLREQKEYCTISNIPLTATQRVKRKIRDNLRDYDIFGMVKAQNTVADDCDIETLQELIKAYIPPFTYATASNYRDIVLDDVIHDDISSFYPYLMLTKAYPYGKFLRSEKIPDTLEEVQQLFRRRPYLVKMTVRNLKNIYPRIAYFSVSRDWHISNDMTTVDNRLLSCSYVTLTITDIDLANFMYFYTYTDVIIKEIYVAKRYTYLPKYLTKTVVELYLEKKRAKEYIKRIEQTREPTRRELQEYNRIKSQVDRISGIMVQRPLKFGYHVNSETHDIMRSEHEIYVKSENDFLVNYSWGVWLLAYARDVMYKKILAPANLEICGDKHINNDKVVYGDTDCVNYNADAVEVTNIISSYNEFVNAEIKSFCEANNDFARYKDLRGIGTFDSKHYKQFKCCMLKRYAYVNDSDEFVTVCSGLSRDNTYFNQFATAAEKFDNFNNEMTINAMTSGIKKRQYKKNHVSVDVVDYLGTVERITVDSYVIIEDTAFNCRETDYEYIVDDTLLTQFKDKSVLQGRQVAAKKTKSKRCK